MRLLKRIKTSDGTYQIRLLIQHMEDLWHFYNLIAVGDLLKAKSRRKVSHENDVSHLASVIKWLWLEVEITDINFAPEELRINGINKTPSEYLRVGAYHAMNIAYDPPQEVLVTKTEWNELLEARLKDACSTERGSDTMAVLMNYGEAQLVELQPSIIYVKAKISTTIAKKRRGDGSSRDKSIQKFFSRVREALLTYPDFTKVKVFILASPGNVRCDFLAYLQSFSCPTTSQEIGLSRSLSSFLLVKVQDLSHDGIRQAIANPDTASLFQSTRCRKDIQEWDAFQTMLSSNPDRCVYTPQMVYEAVKLGAVSSLMVSDEVFRSPEPIVRRFFLALTQMVKQGGSTKVLVFSSAHVTGEQLKLLGNIAAILFFECPELNDLEVQEDFIFSEEVAQFIRDTPITKVSFN